MRKSLSAAGVLPFTDVTTMAGSAFCPMLCLLLFVTVFLFPTLAGAGDASNAADTLAHVGTEGNTAVSAGNGIVVTDARGKNVALPGFPKRIVIAGKAAYMVTDAVYLFPNAGSRVVGLARDSLDRGLFLEALDPGYASKTIVGRDAGPEQIAAAKPDVVLMKMASTEALGKSLEEIGIPVICVDFETPEQYLRDLAILGKLLDQEARAKEIKALIRGTGSRISEKLSGMDEAKKPRVLFLYYSSRDGSVAFNVPPISWMQTLLVKMAGGRPLWEEAVLGQGWTKVSIEQIAVWNPDQIFVVSYFDRPDEVKKALLADERWQALRAVQTRNLWTFPGDLIYWDQPDPRWVLGLTWLAAKTHPELFPGVDMKVEVFGFFRDFYGADEDFVRTIILPALQGDL